MSIDHSNGWNAIAPEFIRVRSGVGADTVRRWARGLPPGGAVVDVGCGSGTPIAATLIADGFRVFGVDASPVLVAEFRRRLPSAEVVCEAAETSGLFGRTFDGAVAIGLLFLLPADGQRQVIDRVAGALERGGRFLFTAPRQACEWRDTLTRRPSLSLGEDAYQLALERAGMRLSGLHADEGGNTYFDARRPLD
ncbi:class I SAM-dependent methyltransferase [Nitrospirillum sp. BR 11163]|uniref:class I SAM-dependent methyltransferase n=1 Tax=Nitrospirillum sp. BR 11163 TaxID=3104323 RepID=UPI002AFF0CE9|nr:class I SAM-dependent methyltransferase [Nitrospirillum sp. BR 11163]MEA1676115.1 class I SAM-dependent methyltransferase [Nitrospirillum sp. BR 11163]